MMLSINKEIGTPVYMQIFNEIRRQILSGELASGYRLPPERKLAERLGINRSTVLNAYRELKAEGLVGSRVGQGTVVLSNQHDEMPGEELNLQEPSWNQMFSQYSTRFDSLFVKDLLLLANRNDLISFATGIASPEAAPVEALAGIEQELSEKDFSRVMLHSPTEGFSSLREAVCSLMQGRGVYCNPEEVMLLSGSQQGIDLAARIILDPGDIVVVEEPSFFPAIQVFKSVGARVMGVAVDEKGMRMDMLEQLLQRYRPKIIYSIPNSHNPTGVDMDMERRKRLVELAYKYRVLILEDDAYGGLCYGGHSLPTLKSMDQAGYVIYMSSFSKIVYPGLRLGWMVAHKKVIKKFASVKQTMDLHSNCLSQWIIERFIKSGQLDRHISKVCGEYKVKMDAMINALNKYAPSGLAWSKPRGGYYIWCRLPEGLSAAKLVPIAAKHKVVFVPGPIFFTNGQGDNFIRLNFTFAKLKDINTGIKGLCDAMKELAKEREAENGNDIFEINPIT